MQALLEYTNKLTESPHAMRASDIQRLKAAGLEDTEISRAAQVIAYFNYINRIADGLGIDLEQGMAPDPCHH